MLVEVSFSLTTASQFYCCFCDRRGGLYSHLKADIGRPIAPPTLRRTRRKTGKWLSWSQLFVKRA
jgi:hypothetical protein